MLEEIEDRYQDEDILKADGFDDAIIGVDDSNVVRLVYSVTKCIEILEGQGMTGDEAMEFFTFNISGAYVGESTPVWCWDNF